MWLKKKNWTRWSKKSKCWGYEFQRPGRTPHRRIASSQIITYVQHKASCTVALHIKTLRNIFPPWADVEHSLMGTTASDICRFSWLLSHWKYGNSCTKFIDYKCLGSKLWMHLSTGVSLDFYYLNLLVLREKATQSKHTLLFLSYAIWSLSFLWLKWFKISKTDWWGRF